MKIPGMCIGILLFVSLFLRDAPPLSAPFNGDELQTAAAVDPTNETAEAGMATSLIAYGEEFWRCPKPDGSSAQGAGPTPTGLNLGDVIERVSHAIVRDRQGGGTVAARGYTAEFSPEGLNFSPRLEDADSETGTVLRTLSITRGGERLYESKDLDWSITGNTAQAHLNHEVGLIEHCEARSAGIEWTWVLTRQPFGEGPLLLEAELSGFSYVGSSPRGAYFADHTGATRACVGPVTLVDAKGHRTALAVGADASRLAIEVPESFLSTAAYPLAIDPLVSPEFPIGSPRFEATGAFEFSPAVAFDGANFLVVWQVRDDNDDLFGARVTPAGKILDPWGILISAGGRDQFDPAVASNGRGWLVVWSDSRHGGDGDIYGVLVGANGTVDNLEGIPISTGPGLQISPAVASNGREYLVAWSDLRNAAVSAFDIYGARVNAQGVVVDTEGIAICTASANQTDAALASDGEHYLVAWADERNGTLNTDIFGTFVGVDGQVPDPIGVALCADSSQQYAPDVGSNGEDYLVAWVDARNRAVRGHDIYATRVSATGVVLEPSGFPVTTAPGEQGNDDHGPVIASNGRDYLVVWDDARHSVNAPDVDRVDIYGARVSGAGAVLDPEGIPISAGNPYHSEPEVTSDGAQFFVVWGDTRTGNRDIFGARVTASGQVRDPDGILLTTTSASQLEPAVAHNGRHFMVVWYEFGGLVGTRVNDRGVPLDPHGIEICSAACRPQPPDIAATHDQFLVVWADYRNGDAFEEDIYGNIITASGRVLHPDGFPINSKVDFQIRPAVAANARDYLVIWIEERAYPHWGISGVMVSRSGMVGRPFEIASDAANDLPALASNGRDFLAVWTHFTNMSGFLGSDLYGARVSASGVVLDRGGMLINSFTGLGGPAVAASRNDYLVAWVDARNTTNAASGVDIYGARVTPDGQVLDPVGLPISTAGGNQTQAAVGGNRHGWLVAWTDERNYLQTRYDVYGARVNRQGRLLDERGFAINASPTDEFQPALAAGDRNRFLVAHPALRQDRPQQYLIVGQFVADH